MSRGHNNTTHSSVPNTTLTKGSLPSLTTYPMPRDKVQNCSRFARGVIKFISPVPHPRLIPSCELIVLDQAELEVIWLHDSADDTYHQKDHNPRQDYKPQQHINLMLRADNIVLHSHGMGL